MGMKVEGIDSTTRKLSRIHQRTSKRQLEAFRSGGRKIHQLSRDNAPVDTGALEKSITYAESKARLFERKDIFIGVDPSKLGEGYGVYGYRYDQILHDAEFNLGERSQRKAASGKDVGAFYFTRALDKLREEIVKELEKIAKEESLD